MKEKKAILLFSGGVDSTYVATEIAGLYDKLMLVTYQVPGMINVEASRKSATQLKRLYGDKIIHKIIDIRKFVAKTRGGIIQCMGDNMRYHFLYSWCMGCKLSMLLYTVRLCRENGIDTVIDGSNEYDAHALEQSREVKDMFASLYKKEGISFLAPSYTDKNIKKRRGTLAFLLKHFSILKEATKPRVECLKKRGINMGKGIGSQYRNTQPSCSVSMLFNVPRAFLTLIIKENKNGYLKYIEDKAKNKQ